MYRFYGSPLQPITSKQTGKVLFVFDTKGEFLTDDDNIIRRCLGFFDNLQLEAKDTTKREKKTYNIPPITITNKNEKKPKLELEKEVEIEEEVKVEAKKERHCKKCDFTCENQGDLLAHYREKHSKED